MADRDLTSVLSSVEQELGVAPVTRVVDKIDPAGKNTYGGHHESAERFAPQKYRNANDTLEQIQQDFRKAVLDMESRFKALIDELKRVAG